MKHKKLVEFGKMNADFVSTFNERNGETHPNFISVDLLRNNRSKADEMLPNKFKVFVYPVLNVFDKMLEIPELDDLMDTFNIQNMRINSRFDCKIIMFY